MRETIEQIHNKSVYAIPFFKDDYEVDGIMHCYKCKAPKETIVRFYWGTSKERCKCKCYEKRGSDRTDEISALREICLPHSITRNITFDKDDLRNPSLSKLGKKFINSFENMTRNGKGLLLYGTENGKTFTALCIVNALIDNGKWCYFGDFPTISNELKGIYSNKSMYCRDMLPFSLIVIDDLNPHSDTETASAIIDTINKANKPFLITTSLSKDEIENASDMDIQKTFGKLKGKYFLFECKGEE